jgi:hypothetical protein
MLLTDPPRYRSVVDKILSEAGKPYTGGTSPQRTGRGMSMLHQIKRKGTNPVAYRSDAPPKSTLSTALLSMSAEARGTRDATHAPDVKNPVAHKNLVTPKQRPMPPGMQQHLDAERREKQAVQKDKATQAQFKKGASQLAQMRDKGPVGSPVRPTASTAPHKTTTLQRAMKEIGGSLKKLREHLQRLIESMGREPMWEPK